MKEKLGLDLVEAALLRMPENTRHASRDEPTLWIILGPPGSGKTSLAIALAQEPWARSAQAYIEMPEANPQIAAAAASRTVDLKQSQDWFLSQYEAWLERRIANQSLVLDQDPRAVVLVYSRLFATRGLISDGNYEAQLTRCHALMDSFAALAPKWCHVILTASDEVLLRRIHQRGAPAFDDATMEEIFAGFRALSVSLKVYSPASCIEFDSSAMAVDDILRSLRAKTI